MTKLDSGSGSLGVGGAVSGRGLSGGGASVPSGGGGTKGLAGRLANARNAGVDAAGLERRGNPAYRALVKEAANAGKAATKAMRDRTWNQSITNRYELAELKAVKAGKELGFMPSQIRIDIQKFENYAP